MNIRTRYFHQIDQLNQPIEAMELTRRGYKLTKGGLWVSPVQEIVTEGVSVWDLRGDGGILVERARIEELRKAQSNA